jgi:hypothetical protein
MAKKLGKLEDFVTSTVASIGKAARNLNVLSFAGAIRAKEELGVLPAGLLMVPGAKVNIKARMSTTEEDAEIFGLGGETEENLVEIDIEIPVELQALDEELHAILAEKKETDVTEIVTAYKLTKFHPTKESEFTDPES